MKSNFLVTIILSVFFLSCSKDDDPQPQPLPIPQPQAFTFDGSAGMSTGTTSTSGTNVPAGFTWSEVKAPQSTWGLNGTVTDRQLCDDFTVPAGETWSVENLYFYAYQTGFAGVIFPVNEFYYEVYSSDPSVAGAVKVFGDVVTNKYISAEPTTFYRILQNQPDNTARLIYKMKIQAAGLNLTPGTYWIKWGSKTSAGTHFYPQLPHDPGRVNNASQFVVTGGTWVDLNDGGQRVSMPFNIAGTKILN